MSCSLRSSRPTPRSGDEALVAEAGGRGLAESVFSIGAAPSEDELARAEAAEGGPPSTAVRTTRHRCPRPDRAAPPATGSAQPRAGSRADAGSRSVRPVDPGGIRGVPLPLVRRSRAAAAADRARGGAAHGRTGRPPGARGASTRTRRRPSGRPTPATLPPWLGRARELITELGPDRLPRERADTAAALRRVEGLVLAFLADEAETPTPFEPPELHGGELRLRGSPRSQPLQLAGGGVHGQIDRIDLGPAGEALVQDYKSGGKVDGGKGMLEAGKLQLQLYMLAARELWGLELAGGLYRPLGGERPATASPKGLLRNRRATRIWRDSIPGPATTLRTMRRSRRRLAEARAKAEEIIAPIHGGRHRPPPARRRLPRLLHLPADLPPRARTARGGARLRGGGRGMSAGATEQQLAAVAERDRDVFLRAGAPAPARPPSWSTASAPRPRPELGVEKILAFTFTERAADQLRRRVREELAERAAAGRGRGARGPSRRPEATDRAWISTIHGFCRRLLATHPAAAGLDPRFRVIDEAEADRLAGRAFDAALEELVEAGEAEALEFAAANRRRTLLEMTRGATTSSEATAIPRPPSRSCPAGRSGADDRRADRGGERGARRVCGGEGIKGAGEPRADRRGDGARAERRAERGAAREARLADDHLRRQVVPGRVLRALRRRPEASAGAVAAHVLGPAYEQLRSW